MFKTFKKITYILFAIKRLELGLKFSIFDFLTLLDQVHEAQMDRSKDYELTWQNELGVLCNKSRSDYLILTMDQFLRNMF